MDFYPPIDWTKHPLHSAAISANISEVSRLIAEGADVNENLDMDVNGNQDVAGSPLHVALRNCARDQPGFASGTHHHEVVRLLLATGADVHSQRLWEGTPLHDAARRGLINIAKLLISYGADVDSRDYNGLTPLHLAAANDRLKMVEFLLSQRAEIDAVAGCDPESHPRHRHHHRGGSTSMRLIRHLSEITPLQLAAREGRVAIVRRLLEAGASLDIQKARGWAAMFKRDSAKRYDGVIVLLKRSTVNPAAALAEIAIAEKLTQRGFDLTQRDGRISRISGCEQLSDNDLIALIECQSLEELDLRCSAITDDGLVHVGRIASLVDLELCDTSVSANGLAHLRNLKNLRSLNLYGTSIVIDDDTVENLLALLSLQWLDLRETPLAKADTSAFEKLRRRNPNLEFHPLGIP